MNETKIFDRDKQQSDQLHAEFNRLHLHRQRYVSPQVLSYSEEQILEELGPAQAGSGDRTVDSNSGMIGIV